MSLMILEPASLKGEILIQPAKASSHRSVICAALAEGKSIIENLGQSDDIKATISGLHSLGLADFSYMDDKLLVSGGQNKQEHMSEVDCMESGSTLRFLLPLALHGKYGGRFIGRGRLLKRPMEPYLDLLRSKGAKIEAGSDEIIIKGNLVNGNFPLPGNISSQYFSGLLFSLPLLKEESTIEVIGKLESSAYLELTRDMQKRFKVESFWHKSNILSVPKGKYQPADVTVESDWSHAAFYLVAGAINGNVTCLGLKQNSIQGDKAIIDILSDMGAKIERNNNDFVVSQSDMEGMTIDASEIPDLVPILAVLACATNNETRIINASRLRIKESNRLEAITRELKSLGANIEETEDGLVIKGKGMLYGGKVEAHGDHRIAMSLAIAATICQDTVELDGWQTVSKSAPNFWQEYRSLGGIAHER